MGLEGLWRKHCVIFLEPPEPCSLGPGRAGGGGGGGGGRDVVEGWERGADE